MPQAIAALLDILDIERLGPDSFRGQCPLALRKRVFGGQIIAQALVAASRTVDRREPHSLHGYFLLPGDASTPISYEVQRLRDGGSFATRRCDAIQHGRTIFSLTASFHIEEPGLDHCMPMPDAPDPETLMSRPEMGQAFAHMMPAAMQRYFTQAQPIDVRPVDLARYYPKVDRAPLPTHQNIWMRASGPLPDDPAVHRAVLAYFSDMTLLDTALVKHQRSVFDEDIQAASLDHALWFHRPFRADEWLLYAQQSPNANGARGLTRGSLFSRDGRLVASVVQEGLLRLRPDKSAR